MKELKEFLERAKKKKVIRKYDILEEEKIGKKQWYKIIIHTSFGTNSFLINTIVFNLNIDLFQNCIEEIYSDYIERQLGL